MIGHRPLLSKGHPTAHSSVLAVERNPVGAYFYVLVRQGHYTSFTEIRMQVSFCSFHFACIRQGLTGRVGKNEPGKSNCWRLLFG